MRFLVWVFFASLALATAVEENFGQGLGQRVYRYEVQLATGSPESSQLWSGMKLTANLSVFYVNNQRYVAQMQEVSLQKMDKFVLDKTPNLFMQAQEQLLDGIEADVDDVMIKQLEQPFGFTWNQGQVSSVTIPKSEPLWSLNIKRGILNLFQVNLDKKFSTGVNNDKGIELTGQTESYTDWEPSPFGRCLTTYTPVLAPGSKSTDSFYLVKVRDYSSCYQRPPMVYSFDNLYSQNNKSTDHLNIQSEVTYAIKGNKDSFVIESAQGQSKVIFVPYARADGSVQTSINQTLYMLKDFSVAQNVPSVPSWQPSQPQVGLQMGLPIQSMEDRRPYILQDNLEDTMERASRFSPWSLKKMDQLLTYIANGTSDYPSQDIIQMTQSLMEMIRQSSRLQLKKLLLYVSMQQKEQQQQQQQEQMFQQRQQQQQQPTQQNQQVKMDILWNLMSYAGTTTASEILLDDCMNRQKVQPPCFNNCIYAVTAIGLYTPPSEKIIAKLIHLVELVTVYPKPDPAQVESLVQQDQDEVQQDTPQDCVQKNALKKAATLAMGAVIGRAEDIVWDLERFGAQQEKIMKKIRDQQNVQWSQSELKTYMDFLQSRLNQIRNEHTAICINADKKVFKPMMQRGEDILLLKTYRNAHIPSGIRPVWSYLSDKGRSTPIRIAAAQALEKFTYSNQKEMVLEMLEKIVNDYSAPPSVRIQCFRSMVNVRAPVHMLTRIGRSLAFEKQKQVSSYVWSTFNRLSNCTFRPYRHAALQIREAMAFIQPVDQGLWDSQYRQWQFNLADEMASLQESSFITSPDFSSYMDFSSSLDMFGTGNKAFQVSLSTEGIQEFWKRMVGPKGFLTNRNSLFDLLKRPKRDTDVQQKIDNIFRQLNIKLRQIPQTKAFMDVQLLDNVMRVWDISDIFQSLTDQQPFINVDIQENKWKAGVDFKYNTSGIMHQFYMEVPTEAGFPVTLQMGLSYTAKTKGKLWAGVDTSIYKDTRSGNPPFNVHASLSINPNVIGALMGKVSVDGYLFQTGNQFHATITHQAPFTVSANLDLVKNRVTARLTPPVNSEIPAVKLEMKPYVYSCSVPNDIPDTQDPVHKTAVNQVNQRPMFCTMQPVIISQGAHIKQMHYTYGDRDQGYQVTIQGQYPWRAEPWCPVSPLLGRSYYALYIDSGVQNPPDMVADVRYFSHPRYKNGACDSWMWWRCYGTDEASAGSSQQSQQQPQQQPQQQNQQQWQQPIPQGKISDIPDLSSPISFHSLKQDIMRTVGHDVPTTDAKSEWGFIAVVNSSSCLVVKGVSQNWNMGKYQQTILTVKDTQLYKPDSEPWMMTIKTSALYPRVQYKIKDLMSISYQQKVHQKIAKMVKRKEHKVINRYFQRLVFTILNNYAVRKLPSMDPQIMIDRIFPEWILMHKTPYVRKVKQILRPLLPLTHQLTELESELEDAFSITVKERLIQEMQARVSQSQKQIEELLNKIGQENKMWREAIVCAEYAVLKASQCVLRLKEIVQRAVKLNLVHSPKQILAEQKIVERQQMNIYQLCIANFNTVQSLENREQPNPRFGGDKGYIVGYGNVDVIPTRDDLPISESDIVSYLKALTQHQLQKIQSIWVKVMEEKNPDHDSIVSLIENTASNVTIINKAIKQHFLAQNKTIQKLVLQASVQHQIIVQMLKMCRFWKNPNGVDNFDRYSIKVQTKELLERGSLLQHQYKMSMVCFPFLNASEKQIMHTLQQLDRDLVSLQQDHIRVPSSQYPWTTNSHNLGAAVTTMEPVLQQLQEIREKILLFKNAIPHPCLLGKLVDTVLNMQQKVALFKRTLSAQTQDQMEWSQQFQNLDDGSMDFVLSLTPLFDMYLHNQLDDQPEMFPRGSILISQSMLDVAKISSQQDVVMQTLENYLDQPFTPTPSVVREVLNNAFQKSRDLLRQLQDASKRLLSSMQTTTPLSAFTVYSQFIDCLEKQTQIYDKIDEQLRLYPDFSPDLQIGVSTSREEAETLKTQCRQWSIPSQEQQQQQQQQQQPLTADIIQPIEENEDILDLSEFEELGEDEDVEMPDDMSEVTTRQLGQMQVSKMPVNVANLLEGIIFNVNITFSNQKYIGIRIFAKKSVEQLMWEATQFFPQSRDKCVSQTVDDNISGRSHMKKACQDTCLRINSYDHVHVHVSSDTNYLPKFWKKAYDQLIHHLMAKYSDRTDIYKSQPFVHPGTMQGVFDISHLWDSVDEYYLTTKKTVAIQSVPMPFWFKTINPFQNSMTVSRLAQEQLTNRLMPSECKVEKGNVKTIDGAVYMLPKTQKPILLAADCSPDKTFAMLMMGKTWQDTDLSNKQTLMILAQEHQVQLSINAISIDVSVDGEAVVLKNNQPVVYYKTLDSGVVAVAMVISREQNGLIHVEYPLVGLDIHFDVVRFTVMISEVYSRQICGLCGNFDGQITNELEGPQEHIYSAANDFTEAYTLENTRRDQTRFNRQ